ncbi:anthranilate synthase component 1 [Sphingosinicella sp. CPCC 101087]|uniref:anthranilate synthase component 1 n=1 Tax=Sphingosinicella sp. CPCC 101087 TaxID=2497754 RepID=UPI00101BFC09|nr:anthranilate synthase component 1 [Sphingosinicella sp. CPCC 101087]
MSARIAEGEALALCRQLPHAVDPLDLYAALSDGGKRPDTMLLQRSTGPSLLLDQAAVRAECRGPAVHLEALSAGGRNVLAAAARVMPDRVSERSDQRLVLLFARNDSAEPEERLRAPSPFSVLRFLSAGLASASREEPFTLACLGVVAFDHVDLIEDLPGAADDPLGFPDFQFWLAESLVVFESGAPPRAVCTAFGAADPNQGARAYFGAAERLADLVARSGRAVPITAPPVGRRPADFTQADLSDEDYAEVVVRMKAHIAEGQVYQIVPSRTFRAPCPDPLPAFATLRRLDPSPYHFFVSAPGHRLIGASPETSVRLFREEGEATVEVKPIAGTRPRGASGDEDDRLEAEMRLDIKEVAEHMMLVDLARNDVARVSVPGTRRVAKLLTVERYARVMHLVSSVTGRLRPGMDALHALQACLNVGTLTGAPKIRATELLRETERTKRGPYGGAIGWINGDGMMDTAVVIRSAVVKDGTAFVRAGAGIVHDSDPASEAAETRRKASALLTVLAGAQE